MAWTARGADDREFPGGDFLDPDDANFDETYAREPASMGPDEVGSYPASRSPFGPPCSRRPEACKVY